MEDKQKTNAQLIEELAMLRQRIAELEAQAVSSQSNNRSMAVIEQQIETLAHEKALQMARYKGLYHQSNDAIFILDFEGNHVDFNARASELLGYTVTELQGLSFREVVVAEQHSDSESRLARLLADQRIPPYERTFRHKDGTDIPVEINVELVKDMDGHPVHLQSIVRDIRERKQAEEIFKHSEAKYREILEQASDGILIADDAGQYTDANTTICNMLGYNREELLSMHITDVVVAEDLASQPIPWDEMRTGTVLLKRRLRRKDGSVFVAEVSARMLHDGRLQIFVRDITERIQAEDALRESEQRYRTVVTNLPVIVFAYDMNGVFTFSEGQALSKMGREPQQSVGQPYRTLYAELPEIVAANDRALRGEAFTTVVPAGPYFFEAAYTPLFDADGQQTGVIGVASDITERMRAEERLRDSEERFRTIFEAAPIGMVITSVNRNIIQSNRAFQQMLGYSDDELQTKTATDITHPDDRPLNTAVNLSWQDTQQQHTTVEKRYISKRGDVVWATTSVFQIVDTHGTQMNSVALITDITDRKRAEAALRESEALYRTLSANLPQAAVLIYDHDLRFVLADGPELEAAGFTKEGLEGQSITEMFPVEYVQILEPSMRAALTGQTKSIEFSFFDTFIYHITFVPLRDDDDHITHGMFMALNITELKEAEQQTQALQLAKEQESERYRALFEQSHDGVFLIGLDGRHIDCNQRAADMLGRTREEVIGMMYRDITAPTERSKSDAIYQQLRRDENPPVYERIFRRKDGGQFPVEIRAETVYDPEGQPLHIQSVVRDITERKQSEQALQASEQRYRSVITALVEGVVLHDAQGRVIAANASAERILGVSVDEMLTTNPMNQLWPRIHEDGTPFADNEAPVIITLQTGVPQRNRIMGIVKSDQIVTWISINTQPLFHDDETIPYPYAVVASFSDITDFRNAEQDRVEMAIEKERMEVLRRFISDASHDLKTPITTINTSLYLMQQGGISPNVERHLNIVRSQADYLTTLVEDMFTMTRLDADFELEFQPLDVKRLVRKVLTDTEALAISKNHAVTLDASTDVPFILADSDYLRRALMNIVSNAINYTHDGGHIDVQVGYTNEYVTVMVRDDGIGISSASQERIFERFFRADESRGHTGGTGLGLAITRKIVETHDGFITVESELNRGSTFTLHLPVADG